MAMWLRMPKRTTTQRGSTLQRRRSYQASDRGANNDPFDQPRCFAGALGPSRAEGPHVEGQWSVIDKVSSVSWRETSIEVFIDCGHVPPGLGAGLIFASQTGRD